MLAIITDPYGLQLKILHHLLVTEDMAPEPGIRLLMAWPLAMAPPLLPPPSLTCSVAVN